MRRRGGGCTVYPRRDLRIEPIKKIRAIVQGSQVVLDDELLEFLLPMSDRLHQIDADGGHAHIGHRPPMPTSSPRTGGSAEGKRFSNGMLTAG